MDWHSLIEGTLRSQTTDEYQISPIWYAPASEIAIIDIEDTLAVNLPQDLRQVLTVSDGVSNRMQLADEDIDTGYFLWPVERIKQENFSFRNDSRFRNKSLPVNTLLFFADAGNGDSYAFVISTDRKCTDEIIIHDHETDEYWQVATSLEEFIKHQGKAESNS